MTPEQLRSLGLYCLWALIGATVATGLNLAQQLSGTDLISIRSLGATFTTSFFGALATVVGTSQLTRFGSEPIARQVDALKTQGVPKAEMVVVSQEDAARLDGPLPAEHVAQIVAALKAEMTRDPDGNDQLISKPPTWLPAEGGR